MTRLRSALCVLAGIVLFFPWLLPAQVSSASRQGLFQGSGDIGTTKPGSTTYDPASGSYKVVGGGGDIWGTADDFRFAWTRSAGDATLTADVHVAQPATFPLAKGVLMFRQSLDANSAYADIAIHADGHITLQYRETAGGPTKDTVLAAHGAPRLRIERRGDRFTASVLNGGGEAGSPSSITIPMSGSLYVGVGVCAHDAAALQTVTFSNVTVRPETAATK